jgi:hypothetical protein
MLYPALKRAGIDRIGERGRKRVRLLERGESPKRVPVATASSQRLRYSGRSASSDPKPRELLAGVV